MLDVIKTREWDSAMPRDSYNDLLAFIQVAQQGSFTRAAAQMGVSPSALSHAIRALEARLDVRLLTRTTRSVSVTEAGERLLASVAPHFEDIDAELAAVSELRKKPSGLVRITAAEFPATYLIWPKLSKVLPDYPDIAVEVTVDYNRTDIVSERYDAGVRLGDEIAKDMIAVRMCARRWPGRAWPSCPRTRWPSTSPRDGWSACWTTGASPIPATTCTTPAAGNRRGPWPSSSTPCGIGNLPASLARLRNRSALRHRRRVRAPVPVLLNSIQNRMRDFVLNQNSPAL
jgi:DNA-binding transcriptional LysR family regulator